MASSALLSCLFCHDPTLQEYRLLSATATVTKQKIHGELRRIPLLGDSVNKGKKKGPGSGFGMTLAL